MRNVLFRITQIALIFLGLVACAPSWTPPPGYRGGLLLGQGVPETVTVQRGDSVYLIARRFNVPMKSIIERNGLQPPYVLYPGQVLKLDQPRLHTVRQGDNLYGISRQYGVDMRALAQKNGLVSPYTIYPGQQLAMPGSSTVIASSASMPTSSSGSSDQSRRGPSSPAPVASAPPPVAPPAPPVRAGSRFVWPLEGRLLSKFGPSGQGLHNDGINIETERGAPVRAAENGVVAYSGNELQGFGNLLLLKHADGWMTAYAHNDELLVRRGDTVGRGQVISRAGSSGNVRSPQLHFELRRGTKAVNPLEYLSTFGS
ncbi:MAG: M23 family metallopeptidase [Rhodospirillaceae bacterium]